MPREAIMANCCIITGLRGSANNEVDIPILDKYKFNDSGPIDNELFRSLVNNIFTDFEENLYNFSNYKKSIECEKKVFQEQTKRIFTKLLNEK